jgi:hypothetical protein
MIFLRADIAEVRAGLSPEGVRERVGYLGWLAGPTVDTLTVM